MRGSEDRTLFVTGTRGCGKTSLVERLSQQARSNGWLVFDVNAENALASLFRQVVRFDTQTSTFSPRLRVTVLGSGATVGGKGSTKASHYTVDDLDTVFLEACTQARTGVFVTIDEIQKMELDDVSRVCGAFQMASRKGCDVALVAAGLPHAFEQIIHHDGCTYMRRSVHEELGLFSHDEVEQALRTAFGEIRGLDVSAAAMDELVARSGGHPYMMQLLGYHAVEYANQHHASHPYELTCEDIQIIVPVALEAYERRSLKPLVDAMSSGEADYVRAMVRVMGDGRVAATGAVVETLGKTHQQVAPHRRGLMDSGVIVAGGHGEVRFNIPFLRDYLKKEKTQENALELLDEWDV